MKAVALILGLFLVIAAGIFYLVKPDSGKPPAAAASTTAAPLKEESRPPLRTGEAGQSKAPRGPSRDRPKPETDRSLANVSDLLTPIQAELVDAKMRSWEPRFRALFDTWGLDSKSADRVLEIIRERETKCTALNLSSYKKGVMAMRETVKKKALEREAAELMIVPIVGADRYDEMVRLEKQLNDERRERANAMISKSIEEARE
jgi:hypothetical protein